MRLLKWIWNPLKVTGAPIHLALLLAFATFCFSAFNGGAIYGVGSSVFETLTGRTSVVSQHALEIANLDGQLGVEKRANSEIRDNLVSAEQVSQGLRVELADFAEKLEAEKQANNKLRGELISAKQVSQGLRIELEDANRQTSNSTLADTCFTSIKGKKLRLDYYMAAAPQELTFRDIFFGGAGEINCPAYVTLREFTPELTNTQRSLFCLNYDDEKNTYTSISEGARDAYLVCKNPKTYCERVNATKEEALAFAGFGVGATAGTATAMSAAGVTVVTHSSGALILTGSSGYIAGTLGVAGTTVVAALTAPLTIAAGVVTVVGVGGSVYLCK